MKTMNIIGLDPSLTATGWCVMEVEIPSLRPLRVIEHATSKTAPNKNKKVRVSSDNLERARTQHKAMLDAIERHGCKLAISEVPSGAQSAKAAMAFGMVIGLLASMPIALVEVTPTEVKMAACGNKIADKEDIVRWAVDQTKQLGALDQWKTGAKNDWEIEIDGKYVVKTMEHQADAMAVIAAGLLSQDVKQISAVLSQI